MDLIFDPPELGTVLYLPGLPGGGSTIYDRSPYGNNGTIYGATWRRLPRGLWYLDFDGLDDKVTSITTATIIPVYTAVAWIKIDTNADGLTFLSFGNGGGPDDLASRALRIRFANEAGAWTSVSTLRVVDTWYFVALVRSNPDNWVKIYVNGVLDTDEAYATDLAEDPVEFQVGYLNRNSIPSQFFDGPIVLARVYNRALSALEIQNHFNQEKYLFGVW